MINSKINLKYFLPLMTFGALTMGGCSTETAGDPPYYFGSAVEQNIAAQVINPDAPGENIEPEYSGARTILAGQRYMADKVEEPKATTTSKVSISGQ